MTLIINDTYGGDAREIVVLIMDVDKVVDEVTDMEIDKQTDMVMNTPNEELICVIGDDYGDDVRGNDVVAGHRGGATWLLNIHLMQVAPPDG